MIDIAGHILRTIFLELGRREMTIPTDNRKWK